MERPGSGLALRMAWVLAASCTAGAGRQPRAPAGRVAVRPTRASRAVTQERPIRLQHVEELGWLRHNLPEKSIVDADRADATLAANVVLGHRRWLNSSEALSPGARMPSWNASVPSRTVMPHLDDAQSRLLLANMGLVISLALRFRQKGVSLADLVQEGSLGLLHAMHKYDPEREPRVKFVTYAYYWVMQHITRAIATKGNPIRTPIYVYEAARRLRRARYELLAEGHTSPSDEALAERARLPLKQVSLLHSIPSVVSLEGLASHSRSSTPSVAGPSGGSDASLFDMIADAEQRAPEHVLQQRMVRQQLDGLLGQTLDPTGHEIVRLRFGLDNGRPKRLTEISRELKMDMKLVRRSERMALKQLREILDPAPRSPQLMTLRAELESKGVRRM